MSTTISPQLQSVLDRLDNGQYVPIEEINTAPELKEAYAKLEENRAELIKIIAKEHPNTFIDPEQVGTDMLDPIVRNNKQNEVLDRLNREIRSARYDKFLSAQAPSDEIGCGKSAGYML